MQVKIEKMDHLGRGIGYINGKIVFVPKTITGDIVEIKITKEKKNYCEGKIINIIEKSQNRIKPKCPYFDKCGGCDIQNMPYESSLNYKKNKIIDIFKKIKIDIEPIVIKNEKEYFYRNKINLKIKNSKIGFYEKESHELIEVEKCIISKESINKVINNLKSFRIKNGNITIRSNYNNEILIVINTKDKININVEDLKKDIKLVGIILNNECIYGISYLIENINDLYFQVSYDSFFQVNHLIAGKIFNLIEENINENSKVLDLYCGVGTLSLVAAKKAEKVVGIEIVPNAVLNAIGNATINKMTNTEFVLNDVEKVIGKINETFDTVIVDPPRSGLDSKTKKVLLEILPQNIIYVSCDPQTLARDIQELSENYEIKKSYIFDMFSWTYHVESMVVLERKNNKNF